MGGDGELHLVDEAASDGGGRLHLEVGGGSAGARRFHLLAEDVREPDDEKRRQERYSYDAEPPLEVASFEVDVLLPIEQIGERRHCLSVPAGSRHQNAWRR